MSGMRMCFAGVDCLRIIVLTIWNSYKWMENIDGWGHKPRGVITLWALVHNADYHQQVVLTPTDCVLTTTGLVCVAIMC